MLEYVERPRERVNNCLIDKAVLAPAHKTELYLAEQAKKAEEDKIREQERINAVPGLLYQGPQARTLQHRISRMDNTNKSSNRQIKCNRMLQRSCRTEGSIPSMIHSGSDSFGMNISLNARAASIHDLY